MKDTIINTLNWTINDRHIHHADRLGLTLELVRDIDQEGFRLAHNLRVSLGRVNMYRVSDTEVATWLTDLHTAFPQVSWEDTLFILGFTRNPNRKIRKMIGMED